MYDTYKTMVFTQLSVQKIMLLKSEDDQVIASKLKRISNFTNIPNLRIMYACSHLQFCQGNSFKDKMIYKQNNATINSSSSPYWYAIRFIVQGQ